jgi:hypothetical protein
MLPRTDHCRACGLRHVQPLSLDLVRRIVGFTQWASLDLQRHVALNPTPKLCLCDPCCGDQQDRMPAQMSNGMAILVRGTTRRIHSGS